MRYLGPYCAALQHLPVLFYLAVALMQAVLKHGDLFLPGYATVATFPLQILPLHLPRVQVLRLVVPQDITPRQGSDQTAPHVRRGNIRGPHLQLAQAAPLALFQHQVRTPVRNALQEHIRLTPEQRHHQAVRHALREPTLLCLVPPVALRV